MSVEYKEGRDRGRACVARNHDANRSLYDNPYKSGTKEHDEWQRGFDASLRLEQP